MLHGGTALPAVMVFLLAACGGSGATSVPGTSSGATTPSATPTSRPPTPVSATETPQATTSPAATTSPPQAGTPTPSQNGSVDLCSLLTAAEIQGIVGGGGWAEGVLTSTGGYCHWDNAKGPDSRVITAIDDRTVEAIKSATAGAGVEMDVSGHDGYSIRDEGARVQTTYVDIGGRSLIVEFPMTSNKADDLTVAKALAEAAISHM